MKILVDSDQFWASLKRDILSAKENVFIQALSFEGDKVGIKLFDLLSTLNSVDIKIIIDSYTKFMISDKFIYSPKTLFDPKLIAEVRSTFKLIDNFKKMGISVKFTSSHGSFLRKIFARDHKKLVSIDDRIVYLGGTNFCEHNFDWHDMMIRIEDESIATFLKKDFLDTWEDRDVSSEKSFEKISFYILDGHSNEIIFDRITKKIKNAKNSIYILSPYLTLPFCQDFKEISQNGVSVTLITPENNNKQLVKNYMLKQFENCNVHVRLYKNKMSHLKAILIDDEYLIAGSSNFDIISYRIQKEIIAIISDKNLISSFKKQILSEDLKNSKKVDEHISYIKGLLANVVLKLLDKICYAQNRKQFSKSYR